MIADWTASAKIPVKQEAQGAVTVENVFTFSLGSGCEPVPMRD